MMLNAYRWQYIVSGIQDGACVGHLKSMVTPEQHGRITTGLARLL